jgi:hypothetical protein
VKKALFDGFKNTGKREKNFDRTISQVICMDSSATQTSKMRLKYGFLIMLKQNSRISQNLN